MTGAALGAALLLSVTFAGTGGEAFDHLKSLAAFGNRFAGAPKRGEAIARLESLLKAQGLEVTRQRFTAKDPKSGREWPMVNLLGRLRPGRPCRILLASHYDTRHAAEEDPDPRLRGTPIQGANDGTSGVAVLLGLAARLKSILPPSVGADVTLFDGEEMGYPSAGGYCAGSRHYARKLAGAKSKPRFGVVLDMVCSPKAHFKTEPLSRKAHPALVDALWTVGESRDPKAFVRETWAPIFDDHAPLSEAGVPSVLLIGYDDPNWHTSRDTLERCSPERLELVQGVLEEFLRKRLGAFLEGCP